MRFSVIGVGRAGSSIIRSLCEAGWEFTGCVSREPSYADQAVKKYGGIREEKPEKILESDIIFITTPDREIKNAVPETSSILAHMSGFLSSSILGENSFSIHPVLPLSPFTSLHERFFTIEGKRVDIAKKVVETLKGRYMVISPDEKPLYHLACVVASNHVLSILYLSSKLMEGRIPEEEIINLALETLKKAEKEGIVQALTGPVERGEKEVIEKELEKAKEKGYFNPVKELFKLNLEVAERKGKDVLPLYTLLKD